MMRHNKRQLAVVLLLLGIVVILLARPINVITTDIGRHLTNGRLFLETGTIPQGNLYSYTHPNFPFINHHWGSGVVFELVHRLGGFDGLSLLVLGLGIATVLIVFRVAWKTSTFTVAALMTLPILPLIATRTDVRPELFSYLFAAITLWIVWRYRAGVGSRRSLIALPLIAALWVNLHIFFVLGLAIIGFVVLDALIDAVRTRAQKATQQAKALGFAGIASGLATLLNPAGLDGVLLPFRIFENYGYRVFENQSISFITSFTDYPPATYFYIVFGILAASWIVVFWQRRWRGITAKGGLSIMISILAWMAIRNMALFSLLALPVAASNVAPLARIHRHRLRPSMTVPIGIVLIVVLILINPALVTTSSPAIGIDERQHHAARFLHEHDVAGPWFNNYDIGGYLIYHFFPQRRVFVDNRPEAYPASFFRNTYIPAQNNNERWAELDRRHAFNAIVFYRHDQTEWGQQFLVNRIEDPAWAPVYVDSATIIFLKRNKTNQPLIDQFELPREVFRIRRN